MADGTAAPLGAIDPVKIIAKALLDAGVSAAEVEAMLNRVSTPQAGPTIDIVNESTVVSDADAAKVVAALQKQVDNDFAPVWGLPAKLLFVPSGGRVTPGHWGLIIMDNSDAQGALGYHDWTADGFPIGKIFAKDDIQYGSKWSVTASHELLEMLGDPDIIRTVLSDGGAGTGKLYSLEVCDACEADELGYDIDGVSVSDFVYPDWFVQWAPTGAKLDKMGKLTTPLQLLPGGYIGYMDIKTGTWQQQTMQKHPVSASYNRYRQNNLAPRVGCRRERRSTPRHQWVRSTR